MNKCVAGRNKEGWYWDNKEHCNRKSKENYYNNKEHYLQIQKEYNERNKEVVDNRRKEVIYVIVEQYIHTNIKQDI